MRRMIGGSIALCLCLPVAGRSEEVLARLTWTQAPRGTTLVPAEPGRDSSSVRVDGSSGGAWTLAQIDRPLVTATMWAVTGEVRYEGVEGQGYLEMWNFFPDGGRYFSRTLGQVGPMASLTGSSGWRRICLPFSSRPGVPPPLALQINVVLPGKGRVDIGPLRLSQFAPGEDPLAFASGAWWTNRQAGWIGGIGGSVLGLLGAVIGWLGGRSKPSGVVLQLTAGLAAVGGILFLVGVAALALAQPYEVWYPLLLAGGILAAVTSASYFRLRGRYRDIELRRIQSFDSR